jgi:hypothetical protein
MLGNSAAPRRRGVALSVSGPALLVLFVLCAVATTAATAFAAPGDRHPTPRQVERFWTPSRMAAAHPVEMTVAPGGDLDVHLGLDRLAATAGDSPVETPEALPYAWNGRLFVMQGGKEGFCSATAIDSASGRLVLTAGHCVNTGPKNGQPATWSTDLEFVPGFNLGAAPYGTFALSGKPRALPEWTQEGNPDFDLGAFLTESNAEGLTLTEAVGGGAKIVTGLSRHRRFETFGYPGGGERMRTCVSGFAGEDPITATFAGPSTVGIHCRWAPGASGGGWLIDGGSEIDGLTTYVQISKKHRTFSPYFAASTVGLLVAGL